MTLTKKELRRLAKEARVLAMECVDGTAPKMIIFDRNDGKGGHCAIGWLEARSGVEHAWFYQGEPLDLAWVVADANNEAGFNHALRQSRLVFPLFALADALEDAAEPPEKIP